MQAPIDFSTLTSAQKVALIVQLLELLNTLTQQVQELQAQFKLNSSNSSKPLSNDGYDKLSAFTINRVAIFQINR